MAEKESKKPEIPPEIALEPGKAGGLGNYPEWVENYRDENGTVVIPYSFEAGVPFGGDDSTHEMSQRFSASQRAATLRHMENISRIADIRFEEVPPEKAAMQFFETRYINEEYWNKTESKGLPGGHMHNAGTAENPKVNVFISSRTYHGNDELFAPQNGGSHTILHELLHALGAQHPDGSGSTKGFEDITALSYLNESNTLRLGDVKWLQQTFGESKLPDAQKKLIAPSDRREDFVAFGNDLTIDLSAAGKNGTEVLNLNNRGYVSYKEQRLQIDESATISKVIGPKEGTLIFTGDKGSTTVIGGNGDDRFFPEGGGDTFTSGRGADGYSLKAFSGTGHVVKDFATGSKAAARRHGTGPDTPPDPYANPDRIWLDSDIARVRLHFGTSEAGEAFVDLEGFAANNRNPTTSIRLEGADVKSYGDLSLIAHLYSDKGRIQIEGKTPEDREKIEGLFVRNLEENYRLKATLERDTSGNPVIVLPLEPGKGREPEVIAAELNRAYFVPDGRLGTDPAGFGVTTIINPETGEPEKALATNARRLQNAVKAVVEEKKWFSPTLGTTAEINRKIADMQELDAIRRLNPGEVEAQQKLADGLNEALQGTGYARWEVLPVSAHAVTALIMPEGHNGQTVNEAADKLHASLKASFPDKQISHPAFSAQHVAGGTAGHLKYALVANNLFIAENEKESGIRLQDYAPAFRALAEDRPILPEIEKDPAPGEFVKPGATPAIPKPPAQTKAPER